MRLFSLFILLITSSQVCAQLSAAHQKSLNAYSAYANRVGEEVSSVIETAFKHYDVVNGKYASQYTYVCPFQMEDYFLNAINASSKNLPPSIAAQINTAFQDLRAAERKVDQRCKALDTYYKLEDYKRDNYAQAKQELRDLKPVVAEFWKAHRQLQRTLESTVKNLQGTSSGVYFNTDQRLHTIVETERAFLDNWKLNFNELKYSGWSTERLQKSIAETMSALEALNSQKPALKYPASSMWTNFIESYTEYLEVKRAAMDEHNFEASQNDKHNNDVYLNFINYFNGALVSNYNTFLQFSERDGYFGVSTFKYVPAFDIITSAVTEAIEVKPFDDLPFQPITISKQKTPIPKSTFAALTTYVEFINETFYQVNSLRSTLLNFNGTANYYWNVADYSKRQPMNFNPDKFQVPLSYYQKVTTASKSLPPTLSKSLNTQAEVILNVLKEMEALGAALVTEVTERKYEKDRLKHVYEILDREAVLFKHWDDKKEKLYADVRQVYDAYPPANTNASWQISGRALRNLVDLDHAALFEAKSFYNGDSTRKIDTQPIETTIREIISNEYENMKGIQKLGRYNGMCPYSPYEDVPKNSRTLAEYFSKLEKRTGAHNRYSDPYYNMIYLYNEIVDDYNKFCELSTTTPHLKSIMQPELFIIEYPKEKKPKQVATSQNSENANQTQTTIAQEKKVSVDNKEQSNQLMGDIGSSVSSAHTRDTIYIEKRDTIYIREPNEELRSMEGYATNNMVLLLDVSGSMNQPDKLPLLKESMLRMLDMMRVEDKISIIIFASKPKVLLKGISFKEEEKIKKAVSDLSSSGKTDGKTAVKTAYKLADETYIRGGNNRIILATDGEFGMDDNTKKLIEEFASKDIFLSVFNFGKGMGASQTLQNLATLGKGNYEAISRENVDVKLIKEAKAKRKK
jgi:Ca-activated chloride channel homolog